MGYFEAAMGYERVCKVNFESETAEVELRSGRV
jgi:hypothetical protein